jgi:enediyne biosynthesis protein E4
MDRLYLNNGGSFTRSKNLLPLAASQSTSVVKSADYDKDGDIDLFIGVRVKPFSYGAPCDGYLLENQGQGIFKDASKLKAPSLANLGMITDALWTDVDQDSDEDLIVVGDWMKIQILINVKGVLVDKTEQFGLSNSAGWWNRISGKDLDGDGDQDYVVGNHGLNSRFKATVNNPITMWVNDFDRNGTIEQVICLPWGNQEYPMALRHDLVSQLPDLKKKYLKYESFKDQNITDIFSSTELKGSIKLKATELRTVVLINESTHFQIKALPIEAQFTPIYGIAIKDFDNDGKEDLALGGNQYRAKPEVGRYDAGYGLILKGDGKCNFTSLSSDSSGLFVKGEIRDMQLMTTKIENLLFVLLNGDSIKLFKY